MLKDDISVSEKTLLSMEYPEKPFEDDSFQMGKEKVESLRELVVEIEELIKNRESLSKSICNEGEKMKTDLSNFINENKFQDPQNSKERSELRKKQIEISELQLKERVECWKDIALLKRELREHVKDLKDREDRVNSLNKLWEN
ncbi:MAG: hypothetical protein Q7S33_02315 [Nanoarchaeota archaeon]|nr:hypothetical protein [Nanoarchaeota archaeon]